MSKIKKGNAKGSIKRRVQKTKQRKQAVERLKKLTKKVHVILYLPKTVKKVEKSVGKGLKKERSVTVKKDAVVGVVKKEVRNLATSFVAWRT